MPSPRFRAEYDERPRSSPPTCTPVAASPERVAGRDTSHAYLAGAEAFSLEALTRHSAKEA